MLRKLLTFISLLLLLVSIPAGLYLLNPTAFALSSERVVYNLPYPGVLPDHPLYPVKAIRDKALDVFTREKIKKAELYLLLSDKRVAMVIVLAKKGKGALAVSTLSKAEKYFLKIPELLIQSKKEGVGASSEFVQHLKLSNTKHAEVAEDLLKDLPQGETESINQIILLNQEINQKLTKL